MPQFFTGQGLVRGIDSLSNRIGQTRLLKAQQEREAYLADKERQQFEADRAYSEEREKKLHERGLAEQAAEIDRRRQLSEEALGQAKVAIERGNLQSEGGVMPQGEPGGEMLPAPDYSGDVTAANPVGQISRVSGFSPPIGLPAPRFSEEQQSRRASIMRGITNPDAIPYAENLLAQEQPLPSQGEYAQQSLVGTPDADTKTPGWQPDPAILSRLKEMGVPEDKIQSAISAARKIALDEEKARYDIEKPYFAPPRATTPKTFSPQDNLGNSNELSRLEGENQYYRELILDEAGMKDAGLTPKFIRSQVKINNGKIANIKKALETVQGGGDDEVEEIDVTDAPSKVVNGKTYYQVNNQWYEAE